MTATVKWNLWARSMLLCSAWCLAFGAFAYVWTFDNDWPQRPIYDWSVAAIIIILFYEGPFSKLGPLLIITQNYWINCIVSIGVGIWPLMEVPSFFGGVCAVFAGIMFGVAAIKGEKGKTMTQLKSGNTGVSAAM